METNIIFWGFFFSWKKEILLTVSSVLYHIGAPPTTIYHLNVHWPRKQESAACSPSVTLIHNTRHRQVKRSSTSMESVSDVFPELNSNFESVKKKSVYEFKNVTLRIWNCEMSQIFSSFYMYLFSIQPFQQSNDWIIRYWVDNKDFWNPFLSPADMCVYNGKNYYQGQTWSVGCEYDCQCVDAGAGMWSCQSK